MNLTSFARTHIGKRTTNEDSLLVNKKLGLYIVADGVGEFGKGHIASKIACKKIKKCIKAGFSLNDSVYQAHGAIVDHIESHRNIEKMATTVAAVHFSGNNYNISWVGDTRVYLWDEKLKLLTRDDSHVEIYFERGLISVEEIATHPDRNFITQALGMRRKEITVHNNSGALENNQVLLICSDGLYEIANEKDIYNELLLDKDMTYLTEKLVKIAVEKNGVDNISLIAIKSDHQLPDSSEVIHPNIVREFDINLNDTTDTAMKLENPTSFDSIDITKLQDLTEEQIALLNAPSQKAEWKLGIFNKISLLITAIVALSLGAAGLFYYLY